MHVNRLMIERRLKRKGSFIGLKKVKRHKGGF